MLFLRMLLHVSQCDLIIDSYRSEIVCVYKVLVNVNRILSHGENRQIDFITLAATHPTGSLIIYRVFWFSRYMEFVTLGTQADEFPSNHRHLNHSHSEFHPMNV